MADDIPPTRTGNCGPLPESDKTKMTATNINARFERIYATDLVYVSDCWKLCGDAHCCSFARYKSNFKMIARTPFQELPLLPGEYDFLASKGWLEQFGDHDHKVVDFEVGKHTIHAESIVSRRMNCACNHDTRPTICRLYPLLPVFETSGRLISTEVMGIYEEMEASAKLDPVCQISSLPLAETNKFLAIADAISSTPEHLFYIEAYRMTKRHVADRLAKKYETTEGRSIFTVFETGMLRRNLIDTDQLRAELGKLIVRFEQHYGAAFKLN